MLQEPKFQLSTAVLTVLTIAAAIAASINYQQLHRFPLPDDGVQLQPEPVALTRSRSLVIASLTVAETAAAVPPLVTVIV